MFTYLAMHTYLPYSAADSLNTSAVLEMCNFYYYGLSIMLALLSNYNFYEPA
jgi:hypothetical protein